MSHRRLRNLSMLAVVGSLVCLGICGRARAIDRDLAYLHSLESHGYGDVAVNYLESLDKTNALSPEVREVFDLEMSRSLRAEAQSATDASGRSVLLNRAQKYLDQFVKNNPNHPEALQAQIASAEMTFEQAQDTIFEAQAIKDPTEKSNSLLPARAELLQVKKTLKPAIDKLISQLRSLGPRPTRPVRGQRIVIDWAMMSRKEKDQEARRQELEFDLLRTTGENALVDYFQAQTYTEEKESPIRKSFLSGAAKSLDSYFQQHRNDDPVTELGRSGFIAALVAHTWYGKAVEELNDVSQAKDVYDEVLESFPDPPTAKHAKEPRTGLEPILARAKFYSLQLVAANPRQQAEYLKESLDFIDRYKPIFRGEWGYEAAAVDLAKRLIATADQESDPKKKNADTKHALSILKDAASVSGEFQTEAGELLQQRAGGVNPNSFDEAIGFIKIAIAEKRWDRTESLSRTAIELLNKQSKKPPNYAELMAKLQDTLAECQVQPVFEDFQRNREPFNTDKYRGWVDAARKAAQENKKSSVAPKAAWLSVYCASILYAKANSDLKSARTDVAKRTAERERDEAGKEMNTSANFLLSNFPGTPEADETRLALARAKWSDGEMAEAISDFESIDPKSEKYGEALGLAGQLYVKEYQNELMKPSDKQDKSLVEKYRTAAIAALSRGIKEQASSLRAGDPLPDELVKTQLLLAEVHMEGKEYSEAAKVLQPLIDAAYAAKSKAALDETMRKIFTAAVRAYVAMDDFKRAADAGNVLIELGPDQREANDVLVDFVRRLDTELKGLRDTLDKMADAAPTETEALRGRIASVKQMMSKMIDKLAERKEIGPKSMVFLGSLFTDVDDFDRAKLQFQKVLNSPGIDERLKLWVGAQLVDILGKEGQLDKATDEIAKLRKQRPNNLDFMKVEAQLWQDWGQKDPEHYDVAAQKWTEIRRRLQWQKVKEATVYYDSVYNASFCLFMEADKFALDPNKRALAHRKAEEADKVLNSELIPNPKLDGPTDVKRFDELQHDVKKLVQRL